MDREVGCVGQAMAKVVARRVAAARCADAVTTLQAVQQAFPEEGRGPEGARRILRKALQAKARNVLAGRPTYHSSDGAFACAESSLSDRSISYEEMSPQSLSSEEEHGALISGGLGDVWENSVEAASSVTDSWALGATAGLALAEA